MEQENKGRIVMAVSNDLLTDQRVERHRHTLSEAGFDVVVLGLNELPTRHRRGWRFYLELNMALRREVGRHRPDIVWANDTDTLLGCWLAARRTRARLVLDCHELFPEVPEIQHKPLVKWVWRTLERWLMPRCDARLTVCESIADYYRQRYGVSMEVVRNMSARSDSESIKEDGERRDASSSSEFKVQDSKLLLYQGRVNLGRGVDWAIDALEWLEDCHLVVAGDGDLLEPMKAYAASKPWVGRVQFLGRVMPDEVRRLTPQADVGLVMLEDMGLSYHYALPNRIGDLVEAGVPMVVSDLPEMALFVRRHQVGEVMQGTGAQALAASVKRVLDKGDYDFSSARSDMDWNKEKQILIQTAYKLCSTTSF
ncbi:MAG: glycosyltransferase [Bacteroidales bacterium]|nr:glycosyltransferase [Bacteroidales bacterium]